MQENLRRGWIKPALLAGFLLLFLILGESPLGPLPPFGKFFDPFSGFWANADADRRKDAELSLPGLRDPVRVVFDKRRVPHVFAQNDRDLFYAQGYLTARDRLWQMEIGTLAAAGRLAEILGPNLLDRDRFQRRLGMLQSAQGDLEAMRKDPLAWNAAEAYADGVNAFIAGLRRADYPIEYKLLDYAPEPWTPLKTALLVKNMQWTLSGGGDDLPLSNTLAKMGPEFVRKFFPPSDPSVEPVIPPGTPWGNTDGTPAAAAQRPAPADSFPLPVLPARSDPDNGSNNFVLAGAKTRSGYPILANDPHLDLSLPSTWYEIQLAAPGVNAYGVSLPGGPGVVIGFNKSIAWGLTNGSDDVFDWYRERFRDSTLSEYFHDRQWKPVRKVIEAIKVRGKGIVYDTVPWTHHGPVVLKSLEKPPHRNMPTLHALRWLAHDPSDELQTLLMAMKARDYDEFSAAVRNFKCPSQNFAFAAADRPATSGGAAAAPGSPVTGAATTPSGAPAAPAGPSGSPAVTGGAATASSGPATDAAAGPSGNPAVTGGAATASSGPATAPSGVPAASAGDIAMDHQGLFPDKWPGQGRFILNGENPAHDWQGWIPMAENPRSRNPARGWLASANQSPTDSTYPHFLGADFLNGTRAKRLAQLVSEADSVDAAGALAILLDDKNLHAAEVLPALLSKLKGAALSKEDSACLSDLAKWDYRHTPGKKAPALFEEWWTRLYRAIWKDDFGDDAEHYQWPSKSSTRRLILEEPDEDWFDDITTPARETLASLARRTFTEACAAIRNTKVTWARYRPVDIRHLAFIDAFSRLGVATGGCGDCVNAQKNFHGPSWRMVVSLGHPNRGLGIYPGGQSGNPGSPHYDDFVADWAAGKAYDLLFLDEPGAPSDHADHDGIAYRLLMKGK